MSDRALEPTWEGLYQVNDIIRSSSYLLADLDGMLLPHYSGMQSIEALLPIDVKSPKQK